ncbi:hypothetical protein SLS58_009976 [Diplodia intermedia]|uniref:Uncharacterized protein n=1 Tax=Diplodia intermedia TaxID=856260 RepID=A0ABR3T9S0_9PEZI
MCYHRFYIFTTCGHSFWQPGPLARCRDASFPDNSAAAAFFSTTCEPRSHPFQTRKLYTLCWHCGRRRDALLAQAELGREEVRFEEWKWRMKYQSPQADENAWRTWGSGSMGREASGGGGGGKRSSGRMRRMSDIIKSGLRKSSSSGGGGGVEKK